MAKKPSALAEKTRSALNRALAANKPLSREQQLTQLLIVHQAMYSACLEGALRADWQALANVINMCHALCEMSTNAQEAERVSIAAQEALIALGRRRLVDDGETPITPDERSALHEVLRLYETLLAGITYGQYNAATDLVTKRLKENRGVARVRDMKEVA